MRDPLHAPAPKNSSGFIGRNSVKNDGSVGAPGRPYIKKNPTDSNVSRVFLSSLGFFVVSRGFLSVTPPTARNRPAPSRGAPPGVWFGFLPDTDAPTRRLHLCKAAPLLFILREQFRFSEKVLKRGRLGVPFS